jgi:hypothetical protein
MTKRLHLILSVLCLWGVIGADLVIAGDIIGLWTKITSPDPSNVAIFYREQNVFKAMGYSRVRGAKVVWHAEGEIKGNKLHFRYHHSSDAVPPGWEPDGVMELTLSDDGNRLTGTASSTSGGWSGNVEFKRVQLAPSPPG